MNIENTISSIIIESFNGKVTIAPHPEKSIVIRDEDASKINVAVKNSVLHINQRKIQPQIVQKEKWFKRFFKSVQHVISELPEIEISIFVPFDQIQKVTTDSFSEVKLLGISKILKVEHEGISEVSIQGTPVVRVVSSSTGNLTIKEATQLSIKTDGTADIAVSSGEMEVISIRSDGTGDIQIAALSIQSVHIQNESVGDIYVTTEGNMKHLEIKNEGMGNTEIQAKDIEVALLDANSCGDIEVHATQIHYLSAHAEGTGDIHIRGKVYEIGFIEQDSIGNVMISHN